MASVEEVKANVAASVDGTSRAVTGIQQVSDQLDDALALLRLTAIGSLHPSVAAALVDVPFLTHFRRAVEITDQDPYQELVRFLATRRDAADQVFRTLSYFDGVNFAARGRVPALYSVALMDFVCPPSTVFAAYNHWQGPKEITVWPWNGHEGGSGYQCEEQLRYLAKLFA